LADDRKDLSKREKAYVAADNIKREEEFVAHMADDEKAKKNQAMANYKSELNAQVRQKKILNGLTTNLSTTIGRTVISGLVSATTKNHQKMNS